ncbi:hypothetical protein [Phaeobacter sp. JH209A]|uniref:hypothetical protein n=1 Tax=Phaeobacter sp. JH209A TaxID=3112505 RepID=UPI003A881D62
MAEYRVREARVEVCNGYRCWRERRFCAERRVSVLGLLFWWWPVIDFGWRKTEAQALEDAQRDAGLRAPLAKPRLFEVQ